MREIGLIAELIGRTDSREEITGERIQILLENPEISEVMINSWDQVFIEKEGRINREPEVFVNAAHYRAFVDWLLVKYNIVVNESSPIVEFNMGKSQRVSLVKESISRNDTVITIRRRRDKYLSADSLTAAGLCDQRVMEYLVQAVGSRLNIFISGQTSTGKTSLLNALMAKMPEEERLIVIEDTPELKFPDNFNAVTLIARKERYESAGISVSDLIKASLRMRPDRIILGEVRREEVSAFIHALNTGHDGSICTGHSQSNADMIHRLLMLLMEQDIPLEAARIQLMRSVDLLVHLSKDAGHRRIDAIDRVAPGGDKLELSPVLQWNEGSGAYEWTNHSDFH